jgi:hypothetical protein
MILKLFSLLMTLLIFSLPCVTLAQQTGEEIQAVVDAKADVEEPFRWLVAGCLTASACGFVGGGIVLVTSQTSVMNPPPARLLGKSPEYIYLYTAAYQDEVRRKRLIYTLGGGLVGSVVNLILLMALWNL